MSLVLPASRIQRVRHELRRREVEVLRVDAVSKNFISVTFAGESLSDFASQSFDDHVKFMFADGSGELVGRDYTPRRFDREKCELRIEFVLHGDGPACEWARSTGPGMSAIVGGPKSSMIIPVDFPWHLLAGDSTALPAIHRRVEELPSQAQVFVLVQVDDVSDRREFDSAAKLDVRWLGPGDELASQVRELSLPASGGFAWCAGEAGSMARLRDALVEKHLPREAMRVAAYWKKSASGFHETL